jgi:hypothetical protein
MLTKSLTHPFHIAFSLIDYYVYVCEANKAKHFEILVLQLDHVSFGVIPSSLFDEPMSKAIVTASPHKYLGNS